MAAVAGHLATKVMEPVSIRLYALDSQQARAHDDAARPGPPTSSPPNRPRAASASGRKALPWRGQAWPSTTGLRSAGAAVCHAATHDHPASPQRPAGHRRGHQPAGGPGPDPGARLSAPTAPTRSSPTCGLPAHLGFGLTVAATELAGAYEADDAGRLGSNRPGSAQANNTGNRLIASPRHRRAGPTAGRTGTPGLPWPGSR